MNRRSFLSTLLAIPVLAKALQESPLEFEGIKSFSFDLEAGPDQTVVSLVTTDGHYGPPRVIGNPDTERQLEKLRQYAARYSTQWRRINSPSEQMLLRDWTEA